MTLFPRTWLAYPFRDQQQFTTIQQCLFDYNYCWGHGTTSHREIASIKDDYYPEVGCFLYIHALRKEMCRSSLETNDEVDTVYMDYTPTVEQLRQDLVALRLIGLEAFQKGAAQC